jgi:hypothetical protein
MSDTIKDKDKHWFSYSRDEGFQLHATADEARRAAYTEMEAHRHLALEDGWDEGVEEVCWGELHGKAVVTQQADRPFDIDINESEHDARTGLFWPEGVDSITEYDLKEIGTEDKYKYEKR